MRSRKPIPRNQSEVTIASLPEPYLNQGRAISPETAFNKNRGTDVSFKGDTVKDISIGLEDIDNAIIQYFNNYIKPTVIQNGNRVAVPVMYGSPERWKSVQANGFQRDGNGRLITPLIMIKREGFDKNKNLGNKLDGFNHAQLYQVVGTKFNQRNIYDNFSILTNRIPSEQYYITAVPDYINVNYSCIVFTDFVEQNNKIVEAIEYASDSYWGDPSRFKFKANIDSFTNITVLEQGEDRVTKSSFNIKVFGYIIPDTVNKDLTNVRSKFYTKAQVIFDLETVEGDIDQLNVAATKTPKNVVGSTSFIGGGNNYTNNTIINAGASNDDITYLNTNITKIANTITVPNTAVFTGASLLQPAVGSTLPPTSKDNFTFFINGQHVPTSLVTLTEGSGNVTLTFNTSSLGYSLETDDEVTAIGKFSS
jgi:hypothetical protein